MSRRRTSNPGQFDLFEVRRPVETVRPVDLSNRIKACMSEALRKCPLNAVEIAARMSAILGVEITEHALYSYTAISKPDHQISLIKFVAFTRATDAKWLWDVLVEDEGLTVLQGREAMLAELGALEQGKADMTARIRAIRQQLDADPVPVRKRRQ